MFVMENTLYPGLDYSLHCKRRVFYTFLKLPRVPPALPSSSKTALAEASVAPVIKSECLSEPSDLEHAPHLTSLHHAADQLEQQLIAIGAEPLPSKATSPSSSSKPIGAASAEQIEDIGCEDWNFDSAPWGTTSAFVMKAEQGEEIMEDSLGESVIFH